MMGSTVHARSRRQQLRRRDRQLRQSRDIVLPVIHQHRISIDLDGSQAHTSWDDLENPIVPVMRRHRL